MAHKRMDHPALKIARDSFGDYRKKKLSTVDLQRNLSTAMGLLDGSLPPKVQDSIKWAENEVEMIAHTLDDDKHGEEVERVWREVQEVLARHDLAG